MSSASIMNPLPRTHLRPLTLSLPLRIRLSALHHRQQQPRVQQRNASSNRRIRKLNNIPPASTLGGPILQTAATGRSRTARTPLPAGDHVVFNPPSSAPNVYHTPPKFLPKTDARWRLWEQARMSQLQPQQQQEDGSVQNPLAVFASTARASASLGSANSASRRPVSQPLPPPVHQPYEKKYHLEPEDIEEMRKLRQSDENTWTRQRLADKFQCSKLFVALVVQTSEARKARLREEEKKFLSTWRRRGVSSLKTRRERRKRKALWGVEV